MKGIGGDLNAGTNLTQFGACSRTTEGWPWRARPSAAASPPMPPPEMSIGCAGMGAAFRKRPLMKRLPTDHGEPIVGRLTQASLNGQRSQAVNAAEPRVAPYLVSSRRRGL